MSTSDMYTAHPGSLRHRVIDVDLAAVIVQLRQAFSALESEIANVRVRRSEAERIARRLADELVRRGATEAEITTIIQEAAR